MAKQGSTALGPYRVMALILAIALGMNLYFSNGLWLWYTVVGFVGFTVLLVLDLRGYWRFPTRILYAMALPLTLHYIGGSLSGVHQIGGPNGLYFVFPWWDDLVHFTSSFAAGIGIASVLLASMPKPHAIVLGAMAASFLGILVEIFEFSQFYYFDTVDQGYYTNTMLDLINNTLGAFGGAAIGGQWGRKGSKETGQLPSHA